MKFLHFKLSIILIKKNQNTKNNTHDKNTMVWSSESYGSAPSVLCELLLPNEFNSTNPFRFYCEPDNMLCAAELNETHFLGIHSFPPAFEALTGDRNIFSSLLKKEYPQTDLLF